MVENETALVVKPVKAPEIPLSQPLDTAEAEKSGSPRLLKPFALDGARRRSLG
jgi:hypothetical protein